MNKCKAEPLQPTFSWQQLPAISSPRSCIWTFVCNSHVAHETIHSHFSAYFSFYPIQHVAICIPQHRKCICHRHYCFTQPLVCISELRNPFYAIWHRCRINLYCFVLQARTAASYCLKKPHVLWQDVFEPATPNILKKINLWNNHISHSWREHGTSSESQWDIYSAWLTVWQVSAFHQHEEQKPWLVSQSSA